MEENSNSSQIDVEETEPDEMDSEFRYIPEMTATEVEARKGLWLKETL